MKTVKRLVLFLKTISIQEQQIQKRTVQIKPREILAIDLRYED